MARKYSPKASKSVEKALHEQKQGTLKGGKGRHPAVKSRKQAIAIGLAKARKAGAKVPKKPSSSRAKPKTKPRPSSGSKRKK
jgi:hypothetical protein